MQAYAILFSFFRNLSSFVARHDGIHERVKIALEGKHIAQGIIILRILAVVIGIDEKLQPVLVEREYRS